MEWILLILALVGTTFTTSMVISFVRETRKMKKLRLERERNIERGKEIIKYPFTEDELPTNDSCCKKGMY